jgi:uncharacterized protein YqeY
MINIDNLIAEARKEQNPIKLEAYKQIKQEFLLRKTKGEDINTNTEVAVLKKLSAHYEDQAQMYHINGREEIANEYKAYANELKKLLPKMMSESEVKEKVKYIIDNKYDGMPTKKDMGKIIKDFKDSYSNVDGALLANVVKGFIIV